MKVDFQYSTDFLAMNAPELSHTCMHLLCTAGEGLRLHVVGNDCHMEIFIRIILAKEFLYRRNDDTILMIGWI